MVKKTREKEKIEQLLVNNFNKGLKFRVLCSVRKNVGENSKSCKNRSQGVLIFLSLELLTIE